MLYVYGADVDLAFGAEDIPAAGAHMSAPPRVPVSVSAAVA